jgi:phospholipid/cholesterol/gamma-HCH transport system substrate-binding protein
MKTEAKVGIFVFIGLLSLFLMSTQVGKFSLMKKDGYSIKAMLDDVTGLEVNSKVKVNGVEVGYVKSFVLDKSKVRIAIFIYEGISIPNDSQILLMQDSILGSKEINIQTGESTNYLKEGDTLTTQKSFASFDKTSDSIYEAANEFKALMKDLRDTLGDGGKENLKNTFKNFEDLSKNLDNLILENKVAIKEAILSLKAMGDELKLSGSKFGTTADILNQKLPNIMSKIDNISTNLKSTTKVLDNKVPTILNKFESIETNLDEILKDNKKPIASAIKSVDGFFAGGTETIKKVDDFLDGMSKSQIELAIKSEYMLQDKFAKSYLSLNYSPSPNKFYLLDVISTDDYSQYKDGLFVEPSKSDKAKTYISAQFAKRYENFILRGGLIENTGGVGFDYFTLNDRFKFSLDVFDFNSKNDVRGENAHIKTTIRYTFLKHIDTYFGYDNFLNKDAQNIFLGVGVRFIDNDIKALLGSSSAFLK